MPGSRSPCSLRAERILLARARLPFGGRIGALGLGRRVVDCFEEKSFDKSEAVGLRRSSGVGCTADVRTPSGPNPSVSPLFRQSEAMKLDARHPEKKQKGVMCVAYGKALTQDS